VNAFHVCGGLLALWALVVSYLGVTRENFPATDRAMRLVGAISVVLVVLAIASAIYTGATEDKKPTGEPGVILPLL
jgi:formate-dependent nitrite reductase membrane component NrfD